MAFDLHRIRELYARLTSARAANLDNLNATVSSRLAASSYTAPDNAGIGDIKTKVGAGADAASSTGTTLFARLSSLRDHLGLTGDVASETGTVHARLAYLLATRLSSTRAAKIDNLDALVTSRAAPGASMRLDANGKVDVRNALRDAAINATGYAVGSLVDLILAIKSTVDTNLNATVSSRLAAADYVAPDNSGITTVSGNVGAKTDLADAAGSVLARVKFLLDSRLTEARAANLDAAVSSRLAATSYTAPDNAGITDTKNRVGATTDAASATGTAHAKLAELLARLTSTRAGYLDAAISGRMPGTTTHRDRIDTAVSTRALAVAIKDGRDYASGKWTSAAKRSTFIRPPVGETWVVDKLLVKNHGSINSTDYADIYLHYKGNSMELAYGSDGSKVLLQYGPITLTNDIYIEARTWTQYDSYAYYHEVIYTGRQVA